MTRNFEDPIEKFQDLGKYICNSDSLCKFKIDEPNLENHKIILYKIDNGPLLSQYITTWI